MHIPVIILLLSGTRRVMSKDVIDNVQAQDFTVIAANDIENACNSGCRSIVGTEIQYLDRCIMIMPSNGDERRGPEISCTKPKLPLSNPSDANRRVNAAQVVPAAKSPAPPGAPADRTISRRISPSTSSEWKDVAWTFIVTVMGTYAVYLLRENRRLELENRKRQAKIIHMRNREEEKLESFKNRDQALQGQLRCASSDMTKWESRCTEAITINKELDEHLKLSRAENDRVRLESSKSSEEVKKLYAEVDEERKRGSAKAQQIEEQYSARERELRLKMENEVAARQMEVESLQHSNNTLQEQLKHCQVNLRHQTDAREKAGKEVTELKVKLSTSTSEVNRSRKELSSCKRRLSDLKEDVARLSAEADTQRGIHRDLESELEQTNASLTQTRKALDVSESNCKLEAEKRKDVDARLKEATREREDVKNALLNLQKLRAKEDQEREEREKEREKEREQERQRQMRDEKRVNELQWELGTVKEEVRCWLRDGRLVEDWNKGLAMVRFMAVLDEFEEIRRSEAQPLTSAAVPWPVLSNPFSLTPKDIQWEDVEQFLRILREHTNDAEAFRLLLGKAQRAFHPDRWRARGLLNTVMDEELRLCLEATGNRVSQAINSEYTKGK